MFLSIKVIEVNDMHHSIDMSFGLARVTENGLFFNGNLYSNSSMIKYQWFELTKIYGEWEIPVLASKSDPHQIYLWDFQKFEIASAISDNNVLTSDDTRQAYFEVIANLKRELATRVTMFKKHHH